MRRQRVGESFFQLIPHTCTADDGTLTMRRDGVLTFTSARPKHILQQPAMVQAMLEAMDSTFEGKEVTQEELRRFLTLNNVQV